MTDQDLTEPLAERSSYQYTCEKCGEASEAGRRDARFCKPCQRLKVLRHLRTKYKRQRTCATCGGRYRPGQQKDLSECGRCEMQGRGVHPARSSPCKLCGGPVPMWWRGLPTTCPACCKDPALQDRIVVLLAQQQARRIERNA